jgi:hypothetical protein
MVPRTTYLQAFARLVTAADSSATVRRYRPLVAGLALLRRTRDGAAWLVDLECDRLLWPRLPRRVEDLDRLVRGLARCRITCRMGAMLAGPLDALPAPLAQHLAAAPDEQPRRLRLDFYGWALMYQPPGMRGRAVVDVDDRHPELPAVFELPLELLDRQEFLESRGFRTRPLLIPTQPEDFIHGPDGRIRNRLFPDGAFRPPCGLDRLL